MLVVGRNDKGEAVDVADTRKLLEDLPNKIRDVLGIMADVPVFTPQLHTERRAAGVSPPVSTGERLA